MPTSSRRAAVVLIYVLTTGGLEACGGSESRPSTSPSAPSGPISLAPSTQQVALASLRIDGTVTLETIGATSQLSATAIFSDGTTKDVTSDVSWGVSQASILAISPTGVLTALDYGVATVSVGYQTRTTGRSVTVTPRGTYIARGRVREPGNSGLPNVSISELNSGRTVTSQPDGTFSLPPLSSAGRLRLEKDDYEPVSGVEVSSGQPTVDVPLQRVIRLSPDAEVTPAPLAPHDVSYTVGSRTCEPCRRVRIAVPGPGTLELVVTLNHTRAILILPSGEVVTRTTTDITGNVPIAAASEVIVYVGLTVGNDIGSYSSFKIAARMR